MDEIDEVMRAHKARLKQQAAGEHGRGGAAQQAQRAQQLPPPAPRGPTIDVKAERKAFMSAKASRPV